MKFVEILTEAKAEKFVDLVQAKGTRNPLNSRQYIYDGVIAEIYARGPNVRLVSLEAGNGDGSGKDFIEWVVIMADRQAVDIELATIPLKNKNEEKIIKWYEKYGFIKNDKYPTEMIRYSKYGKHPTEIVKGDIDGSK